MLRKSLSDLILFLLLRKKLIWVCWSLAGECWIALLKNIRPELSTDAADMLVQLLDKELESLPRGMFNLSELQSEPLEYKSLPYHSICNALIQHIRAWCDKLAVPNSVEQCLRIVASEKTRCLPPLNLNFLLNLQTSSVEVVVKICWKGSTSSMSAKNIIEDRLKQFSPDKVSFDTWKNKTVVHNLSVGLKYV